MRNRLNWTLLGAGFLVAAACGGGGGSGGPGSGGAALPVLGGVTSGTITGFGSVIVDGVRYRTSGTTAFDVSDGPGGQADLAVGQQVTISWTTPDGGQTRNAQLVTYDDVVEGPITAGSIDLETGTFVVLGQVIAVGPATSFDDSIAGRSLAGLAAGDRVEVSGLIDAAGVVQATRIERASADAPDNDREFEVHGTITSLDPVALTFVINGLTVSYAGIAPVPPLANGLFVEVEGTVVDAAGTVLTAEKISPDDDRDGREDGADDGPDGDEDVPGLIRFKGFVTAVNGPGDFAVNGRPVRTTQSTEFDDGGLADIVLGVPVEVEATFDQNGVIVASKIDFGDGPAGPDGTDVAWAGVTDVISEIPAADTLVVGGVTVRLTARTRYEDYGSAADQFLNAAALQVGDFIEVKGVVLAGNVLEAWRLEREDADEDETSLRGPITAISAPAVTILGIPFTTDAATRFEGGCNGTITAAQFFGTAVVGAVAEADFARGVTPRVAQELELEGLVTTCPVPGDDNDDGNDDGNDD